MTRIIYPEEFKLKPALYWRRFVRDQASSCYYWWRTLGMKCAMTNGCFDLLHPGHLKSLEAARALGDLLVVAMNSDESVRGLKGPGRPIQDQDARALVLAALRCVDWVFVFDEPTPIEIIRAVRPDVLVKGTDWRGREVAGAEEMAAWGGRLEYVENAEGYSTTETIKKILLDVEQPWPCESPNWEEEP